MTGQKSLVSCAYLLALLGSIGCEACSVTGKGRSESAVAYGHYYNEDHFVLRVRERGWGPYGDDADDAGGGATNPQQHALRPVRYVDFPHSLRKRQLDGRVYTVETEKGHYEWLVRYRRGGGGGVRSDVRRNRLLDDALGQGWEGECFTSQLGKGGGPSGQFMENVRAAGAWIREHGRFPRQTQEKSIEKGHYIFLYQAKPGGRRSNPERAKALDDELGVGWDRKMFG